MAVVQESTVGISSNPDPRPVYDSTTLVTPANASVPNRNNMYVSIGGRKTFVASRPAGYPYSAPALLKP
jgi:hypothetical protein